MKLSHQLDLVFLKRFWQLFSVVSGGSPFFYQLFWLLVLLKLLEEFIIFKVGLITSQYYLVLGERDSGAFVWHTVSSVGWILLIALTKCVGKFVSSLLYLSCRTRLTKRLHQHYFAHNQFYSTNVLDKSIDNPDQRITQDVDKFCLKLSGLLPAVLIFPFTVSYYSYTSFVTVGWTGPVSIFGYFLLSTIINKFLMGGVVALVYFQEKLEGHFRYQHMHVRANAESIAFQDGAEAEHRVANERLDELLRTQEQLFAAYIPLDISVNLFNYLGSIVSFLIIAIPVFSGYYSHLSPPEISAIVSENTFVTMYLISCFSSLINLSDDLTILAGTSHRVGQMMSTLSNKVNNFYQDDLANPKEQEEGNVYGSSENFVDHPSIQKDSPCLESLLLVSDLCYSRPGDHQKPLVNLLSFTVRSHCNLLITGASGAGKTSLLRVLKGLWPKLKGHIQLASMHDQGLRYFYLPQKSLLLTKATLRQQISYPVFPNATILPILSDQEVIWYLSFLDLSSLMYRLLSISNLHNPLLCLDVEPGWDWNDALSAGEAQRLSFFRVFYHQPRIAFLDESLSATSKDMESKCYLQCAQLGINTVSVGHGDTLCKFHSLNLHLRGNGKWDLREIG